MGFDHEKLMWSFDYHKTTILISGNFRRQTRPRNSGFPEHSFSVVVLTTLRFVVSPFGLITNERTFNVQFDPL